MADALGRPLAFHLTVGEAADCRAYDTLIGQPERAPDALLADKGYDADAIRADLAERRAALADRKDRQKQLDLSWNERRSRQNHPDHLVAGHRSIASLIAD
ncbi:transposase [Novosphingobium lindaniclasticum]|uniref:transposase n=1 Tax=Novosphingobium lindaniclasticum TaxID=1329895 RepID=UPI003C6E0A95